MIQEPVMDTLRFFEGHQDSLDLFEAFEEYLYDSFTVIRKRVQKTQISYSNRYVFACISFARVKRNNNEDHTPADRHQLGFTYQ